jgi:asparagine synthase (glutamine-hydrolysing)
VAYRKIADVPLGTFLSGGIDSTIVTGVLARQIDRPVETFSVGFAGTADLDESEWARAAARHHGTLHHELTVSPVDIAEHLPLLIRHLGEPVTDPALIPTYLLSRFARERVTVVLTGEGADELFGGYRRYRLQQRLGWLGRCPVCAVPRPAACSAAAGRRSRRWPAARAGTYGPRPRDGAAAVRTAASPKFVGPRPAPRAVLLEGNSA